MNLAGQVARVWIPEPVRRRALEELFGATATAFGCHGPDLTGASADALLASYASFTASEATAAIESGRDLEPVRKALFDSAAAIGTRLRRELGVASTADAMAAARAVYRCLRVDFRPASGGEIRIGRCFFSDRYSAAVCRLMSSLDQGLLSGLSGGGRLEFTRRITEGASWCAATFTQASA